MRKVKNLETKKGLWIRGLGVFIGMLIVLSGVRAEDLGSGFGEKIVDKISENSAVDSMDAGKIRERGVKKFLPSVVYTSEVKKAPMNFTSLGLSWKQSTPLNTAILLEVRLKSDFNSGGNWSIWHPIEAEIDSKGETETPWLYQKKTAFLASNESDQYQYRVTLSTTDLSVTPVFEDLEFTFLNGGTLEQKTRLAEVISKQENENVNRINELLLAQAEKPKATSAEGEAVKRIRRVRKVSGSTSRVKVISRAEWGADESLRVKREEAKEAELVKLDSDYYEKFAKELKIVRTVKTNEKGEELTWPMTYPEKISKIVIHHTATTKNLDDPKRAIRDIYYWHTMSRGWGDIGYNYIIDPMGNVYEGRFGGEGVVGAHAGKGNVGSIGIAVLGNYQENEVPEPVLNALTKLIREKARMYDIDTTGESSFRGVVMPNLFGHKDIMATSCPGDKLYALLPMIRKITKVNSTGSGVLNSKFAVEMVSEGDLLKLNQRAAKSVKVKLKNLGSSELPAGTKFQVVDDETKKQFFGGSLIESVELKSVIKSKESFEIELRLPATTVTGNGLLKLVAVINGKVENSAIVYVPILVEGPKVRPKFDYSLVDITYSKQSYQPGDVIDVVVRLRNKGSYVWDKYGENRIKLGSDEPRDHVNNLLVTPSIRLADMVENKARYNEVATFKFQIKVPSKPGIYREFFTPVIEQVSWLPNKGTFIELTVGDSKEVIGEKDNVIVKPVVNSSGGSSKNIADTKLDLNSVPGNIRIDLSYRGNPAVISADGRFGMFDGKEKLAGFLANEKATVYLRDGRFEVEALGKKYLIQGTPKFVPENGAILRIDNYERRNSWGNKDNNNEFRGNLEVLIYENELHVINELPLEDYMLGIAEQNAAEPYEKIKAITILARTYARFYMEVATKFPGAPFHLNDDPNYSQKYIGYSFEKRSPVTVKAVRETKGEYVTYEGKLIKTPYFSVSNGKTISAAEKWGWTDAPFLKGVDDSLCKSTEYNGHGVGLSGCGAKALAELGKNYIEIIKYYYTGVEVTKTNK